MLELARIYLIILAFKFASLDRCLSISLICFTPSLFETHGKYRASLLSLLAPVSLPGCWLWIAGYFHGGSETVPESGAAVPRAYHRLQIVQV